MAQRQNAVYGSLSILTLGDSAQNISTFCLKTLQKFTKNVVCANMQVEASGVEGTRAEDLK